jgi:hypothetical protein
MKAYAISLNTPGSRKGFKKLVQSSKDVGNEFDIELFEAITPPDAMTVIEDMGIVWEHSFGRVKTCPVSGLEIHPYKTANPLARIACFASHASLWKRSVDLGEPILIHEDDSVYTFKLVPEDLLKGGFGAVGFNDPRGATRRAGVFHAACRNGGPFRIIHAPQVDREEIPQGLAGASSYMITPWLAELLLAKCVEMGGHANDLILCRQLFPMIGVTTDYFTKVSGRPSQLA